MEEGNNGVEVLKEEIEKLRGELEKLRRQKDKERKNDYYSHYKVAHHREKIEQLKKYEMIAPIFAQIDLINACNLNCSFCTYRVGNYSLEQINDFDGRDKFEKSTLLRVLREMRQCGVKAVEWSGGGEPTIHPEWKDIIRWAKELGYEQALVTNGTLLDDEGIALIKDFEWVRFSVDAATEETYQKIKGNAKLSSVLENIKKLINAKSPKNMVGFSFVVCKENYHEIYEAAKLAKSIGANNIRFSLAYTPQGKEMFNGIWDQTVEQIEKAKKEQTSDFKVFAFPNRIDEISQKTKSDACYFQEFVATIGANANIYPCCLLKYNQEFSFGDLNNQSFASIWWGNKRKKFTKKVRGGCDYSCWMTSKNDFIAYLLEEEPTHVNFI